jgi:four helix bundle protein
VGWRSHRDIEAWRLAHDIRGRIVELTDRANVKKDFVFCDQARRAAGSACRNLAEGFYRHGHPEFAKFVNFALGSEGELLDCLEEAGQKNYVHGDELADLTRRIHHAMAAASGLRKYLQRTPTPSRGV